MSKQVAFLTLIFLLFGISLGTLQIKKVYAYGDTIERTTKYQVYINKTKPQDSVIKIIRTVKLVSNSLELPKNNHEYFNVCPADGKSSTLEQIKKSIHAYGEHGNSIPFSIQGNGSCWLISVKYEHNVRGYQTYSLHVNYKDPSVAVSRGGVLELSYPRLKNKPILSTTKIYGRNKIYIKHNFYVQFIINKQDLSSFHVYVAGGKIQHLKANVYTVNNKVIISYNLKDIWQTGVYAILGNRRYIKFSVRVPNKNTGALTSIDKVLGFKQLILPRSDKQTGQMVYYSVVKPKPLNVQISESGNLIATFPAGKDILVQGYASITYKYIDISKLQQITFNDYVVNQYLAGYIKPDYPYWPSEDPKIKNIANSLKQHNVLATVVNDVDFVTSHLKYDDRIDFSRLTRKGALKALAEKKGVCMEYSDLLLTILRAQGIAARAGLGNVLTRFVDNNYTNVGHQWVEVYFPNQGWVIVDPTLSDKTSIVINQNLNYFTYVNAETIKDLTQLKCFSWSKSCNNIELSVDFVNSIPLSNKSNPLYQEEDLLINHNEISVSKNFNTFMALDEINKFEQKLNALIFANRLPELNVTALYIILFIIVYFIVYLIVHILRWIVHKIMYKYYCKKMEKMAPNCNRIVSTIQVTTPVTSNLEVLENNNENTNNINNIKSDT